MRVWAIRTTWRGVSTPRATAVASSPGQRSRGSARGGRLVEVVGQGDGLEVAPAVAPPSDGLRSRSSLTNAACRERSAARSVRLLTTSQATVTTSPRHPRGPREHGTNAGSSAQLGAERHHDAERGDLVVGVPIGPTSMRRDLRSPADGPRPRWHQGGEVVGRFATEPGLGEAAHGPASPSAVRMN